jgi:2-aminobenzoate-CoA ligase
VSRAGFVNDRLPPDALPETGAVPDRGAMAALEYPATLNAASEFLERNLERGLGAEPALHTEAGTVTYAELTARVRRLAGAFRAAGVQPGDRLLLHLSNGAELASAWLATLWLGAVAVTTVPALGPRELAGIAAQTTPRLALTTTALAPALAAIGGLRLVTLGEPPAGAISWDSLLEAAATAGEVGAAATGAEDVALVAFTSGTTGAQKGTLHTHADLLAIADTYAASVLAPTPADRFCSHAPLGFTYGLGGLLIFPLRFGASAILHGTAFHPRGFLDLVARARPTILLVGPTICRLLVRLPETQGHPALARLRRVVSAGERLSAQTWTDWREATGTELLDGCGSTEMLHIWLSQRSGESVGGAVGRPVPHYEVRLHDPAGHVLGDAEAEGELSVRGPTGCRYWRSPEQQRATVRDGWTWTRDRFRRDREGRYFHLGRADDLIVTGGCNVAPGEVEDVLLQDPRVRQAVVVGARDALAGENVWAYVVADSAAAGPPLAAELRARVRAQLAPFKCPQKIVFLADLPRTTTGKVSRSALRSPDV